MERQIRLPMIQPSLEALRDRAGEEVSRNQFWIVAPDARPSLALAGERFASGDPLPLVWRNGPGNRYDWIAVYEPGATEGQSYRTWSYVGASSSGEMQLSARNVREGWPLPPGRYVARFLLDDGYAVLAESAPLHRGLTGPQ